jgi:hypothetical protein
VDEKSNKIKSVTSINGQEMIQVFDGVKGYVINPMTGSTDPVEMTPEQVAQTLRSSLFQNYMASYLKSGKLALDGEDKVNDKPAYKIKATLDGGSCCKYVYRQELLLSCKNLDHYFPGRNDCKRRFISLELY